jgi:hypothetical protein
MKRLFTFLTVFFLTTTLCAQSPEKVSYQAVIRNSTNNLVTNQTVGLRISILRGSTSGTAVYIETQNPTTNANGLITIEIGNGAVQSGNFANIDWTNGPYFIKTETDPSGGSNYTITGTSQLLSVPYALHAKTAERSITETDPVYTASQAANITATDITNLSNLSGVNTGDQDISGIATNTQAIKDTAAQIRADIPSITTYSIGDFTHGGIVFWLDETKRHGLVCAKTDQTSGVRWYSGTNTHSMAFGDGPLAGNMNTAIIIANEGYGDGQSYAARYCNELKIIEDGKSYADWYLPSIGELNLMYQNKAAIDATATAHGGTAIGLAWYWSSTENGIDSAWSLYFPAGGILHNLKSAVLRVRAVRAF